MPARGPKGYPEIACLGLAFHVLAWYMDDAGSPHACIAGVSAHHGSCTVRVYDPQGCNSDTISFVEESLPRSLKLPTLKLDIACSSEAGDCYSYDTLSAGIARRGVRLVRELLERFNTESRELFMVIGWNGEIAYGVGGETSVQLPSISAPLFAHTHPSSICYPSHRDLESTAGFFAEGGIVSLIASNSCTFILRLVEPLSEDDYWLILDVARRLREVKEFEEYMSLISSLSRLRSIATEVA
jgi:hypothetical protein